MSTTTTTTTEANSVQGRTKKPPPLSLPVPSINHVDERPNQNQSRERRTSLSSCSSASSVDCSHKEVPLVLPTIQRPQILELLRKFGPNISIPCYPDVKQKKMLTVTANHLAILRERQSVPTGSVDSSEWMNLVGSIIEKSFNAEFQNLLDKYKLNYFDRLNAKNVNEEAIRSYLCGMAATNLNTYSSISMAPESTRRQSSTDEQDDTAIVTSAPNQTNSHSNKKRKLSPSYERNACSTGINAETKFLIGSLNPRAMDTNKNNVLSQSTWKKLDHLSKYIPNREALNYLITQQHLNNNVDLSSGASNHQNLCLFLRDEVLVNLNENEREICGISMQRSFTLPKSILVNIFPSKS